MAMRIPTFSGAKGEDVDRFIRTISIIYKRTTKTPAIREEDEEERKVVLLSINLTGEAVEWLDQETPEVQWNWDKLTVGLRERFPKAAPTSPNGLKRLFQLKQNHRSLAEYFREAQEIQRCLPSSLENEIATFIIQGLDDDITKKVVGSMFGTDAKTASAVFRSIEGASNIGV